MATWEFQLLSRITRSAFELPKVLQWGITEEDFLTNEGRALFRSILGYYTMPETRGSILGEHALRSHFPTIQLVDDGSMTTEALCVEVRKHRLRVDLRTHIQQGLEMVDFDPLEAATRLSLAAKDIINVGLNRCVDVHFHSSFQRSLDRSKLVAQGYDFSVARWPWKPLQRATMGLQPDDYVVIYGRPKSKKCIPIDEPVLSWDGTFTVIGSLQTSVTINHSTLRWTPGSVVQHTDPQPMECFGVTTESGHQARLGMTHPILRPDLTYTPCGQLKAGDYIGVARELPEFPAAKDGYSANTAELLGLLIGDGNYTRSEVQFTSKDPEVVQRLKELVAPFHCHVTVGKKMAYRIVSSLKGRGPVGGNNGVLNLLRTEKIHGSKGREKKVPDRIFRSGRLAILAILGGLLTTDGHVAKREALWSTSSLVLAKQIKHLLLRIGVVGILRTVQTYSGPAYNICVSAQEQCVKLIPLLRFVSVPYKRDALLRITGKPIRRKRHSDGIPWSLELETAIHTARPDATNGNKSGGWGTMPWRFSAGKLFRRTGCISRQLLRTVAKALDAPQLLRWADSPVRWERVKEVRPLGVLLTADAGVETHHNFLVGDIITHNSWSLAAVGASLYDQDKRLLIYTKEMTPDNIFQRIGCIIAGVDYDHFRNGTCTALEWMSVDGTARVLALRAHEQTFVCLNGQDAPKGGDTVEWLDSKVDQYNPHAILIDGMYLMSDSKGSKKKNEKVANISNDLRNMVLKRNKPVICTLQANRDAAKNTEANLDEIGFSDAIGQDATLLMRAINEDKSGKPTIAMIVGGARECRIEGFRIYGIPATNFGDFHPDGQELTGRDVENARASDTGDSGKKEDRKNGKKGPTEESALIKTTARLDTTLGKT